MTGSNGSIGAVTPIQTFYNASPGVLDVSPYKVDFVIPSTLPAATYSAYIYNGHGESYGFSNFVHITVAQQPTVTSYCLAEWMNLDGDASSGIPEY